MAKKTNTELVKVVKEQKINKKTGQIKKTYYKKADKEYKQKLGTKKIFIDKNGNKIEGILQKDGLFHLPPTGKEQIVTLYDGEQNNELKLQIVKLNKEKPADVIIQQDKIGKILSTIENLKKNKDVIYFDMREHNIPKDDYQVLEVSHLINTTYILNTEFKANKEVVINNKQDKEIGISFSSDFNTNQIDFSYYNTLTELCKQNKDKGFFTLNEFIRAHTGQDKNEDIRRYNKENFYNRLKVLSLTKGTLRVEKTYLTEWQNRNRDALDDKSVSILGRENIYDVFPCDFIDYVKHPNANKEEAVFYFDSEAFFNSPLYLIFRGLQQWVTIPQRQKLLGDGVRYSDENQVIHDTIIRILKSYDKTKNPTLEKKDFAKDRTFKTRTEKARFISKLKTILANIQKELKLKTTPYFHFDHTILRFDKQKFQADSKKEEAE